MRKSKPEQLADGYSPRHPRFALFRRLTNDECRQLEGHHYFRALDGTARRCRTNGQLKTWKRDKDRFRLPVKYGLYEYSAWQNGPHGLAVGEDNAAVYPLKKLTSWTEE